MANITTTSDYLTWNVNLALHTDAEIENYVTNLDITNEGDVRSIIIQAVDKVIIINGITFAAPIFQDGVTRFGSALGAYSYINNNRVKAIHYYPDRDHIMVEYLAHPVDVRPRNTYHTCTEFGSFFTNVFTAWKTALTEIYAGTLLPIGVENPPIALPTGP